MEAEDIPPPDRDDLKTLKYLKKSKIYSDDVVERHEDVFKQIKEFEEKNFETGNGCELKTKHFVNIYDNRDCFKKETNQ